MFKDIFKFSFFTIISKVTGLIRDILIIIFIGVSSFSDIFFFSFRFTNMFRTLFLESAFTNSFVPLYSKELNNDAKKAFIFASSVISFILIILLIFYFIIQIFSPYIIQVLIPGFEKNKFNLTVKVSRIMMSYLIFTPIVSLISGMLQVKGYFISTAISPIILNLCLIISLFIPYIETPIYNLSIAFLIGGIFQLFFMLFNLYKLKTNFFLS